MNRDVFNGDADSICAPHQLRLIFPATHSPVTGSGRKGAAGIDRLPRFMQALDEVFSAASQLQAYRMG